MVTFLELSEKDQRNIKDFKEGRINFDVFKNVSKKISEEFFNYILVNGFPFKNCVSDEEYRAGISLSLHLPLEHLKKIFLEVEKAPSDEIDLKYKAYFIDKIRIGEGSPQLYGTQIKKNECGKVELFEVEDMNNLDKRRNEMGLESVDEYLKNFDK